VHPDDETLEVVSAALKRAAAALRDGGVPFPMTEGLGVVPPPGH
jgi:hypothetical protein